MPYETAAGLIAFYGSESAAAITATGNSDEPDNAKITTALADASAQVDSYLGARYTLPIANPPVTLKNAVRSLAWQALHQQVENDAAVRAAMEARRWLEQVAQGKATLGGSGDSRPASELRIEANDDPQSELTRGFGGAAA